MLHRLSKLNTAPIPEKTKKNVRLFSSRKKESQEFRSTVSPVDNVIGKYYPRCTIDVKFGKETTFKVSVLLTAGIRRPTTEQK